MFQTLPPQALNENIIHRAICQMIDSLVRALNSNEEVPAWPELIPDYARDLLHRKRNMRNYFDEFYLMISRAAISNDDRNRVVSFISAQNNITLMLSGNGGLDVGENLTPHILNKIKEIYEEGFELLGRTGIRLNYYKIVYDSFKSKTCPFCGFMPFEAPSKKLKNEDLDHYLERQTFPAAAANLENLIPTCTKCNCRYKGTENILLINGNRRKALYPFGNVAAELCLRRSDPFGSDDTFPLWEIELLPDIEEIRTWDQVYKVRDRIAESALSPNYESTLDEMMDFFKEIGLVNGCEDQELIDAISRFYNYKFNNPEQGLGFLKHKIIDMLWHRVDIGDQAVISMVRAGIRPANEEAA